MVFTMGMCLLDEIKTMFIVFEMQWLGCNEVQRFATRPYHLTATMGMMERVMELKRMMVILSLKSQSYNLRVWILGGVGVSAVCIRYLLIFIVIEETYFGIV